MKLILCMIIIAAALAVGLWLNSRLSERTRILSAYITMLNEVSLRMTYTCEPLSKLFAENFAGYVFTDTKPFSEQFRMMTRQFSGVLTTEDIRLLDDFTHDLGAGDTASELSHIRLYSGLLTEQLNSAQNALEQKGRLYRILPLSVGIAAAILLI